MKFHSTYLEPDGTRATAVFQAEHESGLVLSLQEAGRILITARPVTEARREDGRSFDVQRLLPFTDALESLLGAGVPVLGALEAVRDLEKDVRARCMLSEIIERIQGGDALAEALAHYPLAFSQLYVEIVASGEATGSIGQAFGFLREFLRWQQGIRKLVKQATIYPIVLLVATYGLLLSMLAFTLPRLKDMLTSISDELPTSTRVLMAASDFVAGNVGMVLLGTAVLVGLTIFTLRTRAGGRAALGVFLRLPVARDIILTVNRAVMCRTVSILLNSGATLISALQRAARMSTNPQLRESLTRCVERLTDGEQPSTAFEREDILPDLSLVMVRAGERSGDLTGSFGRLGVKFDEDAKAAVARGIAIMEPLMTAILAVIVLGVAGIVVNTLYSAFQGIG